MDRVRAIRVCIAAVAAVACLAAPAADATTFNANAGTLGNIPDSPPGGALCGDYTGAPLDVTFTVSGLTAPVTDVQVGMSYGKGAVPIGLAVGHTWGGDVQAVLIAPGNTASKTILSRTGAVTATSCGDGSDLQGPYVFADSAPATPTWWTAAAAVGDAAFVAPGTYPASTPGGAAGGGVNTPITSSFSGLSPAQLNGTWTLRVLDGGQGDTGSVAKAGLAINGVTTPTLTTTTPGAPADNNTPLIRGSATAGSSISIYFNDNCTGSPAATGTEAELGDAGIPISVPDDSETHISAASTGVFTSGCSNTLDYVEDSKAPTAPTLTATDPASPGPSATPKIQGDAEAGSTVRLYANDDCSGTPAASGGADSLAAGISVSVPIETTTRLTATATDAAGHTSTCSAPLDYTEDEPPAAPALTSTNPPSPAGSATPQVTGSVEAGTQVTLFTSGDCTGPVAASGTDAQLAGPGIPVPILTTGATEITARATDANGLTSACSTPISYIHEPSTSSGDTDPPETSFKKKPRKRIHDETPTFKSGADEPVSTFLYKVDRKPFKPAGAKRTFHLRPGRHKVLVAAVDAAGNVDPSPARVKFRIDR